MHAGTMQVGNSFIPKNIPYCPIKDLDFTSAKGKKKSIDDALEVEPHPKRIRRPPSTVVDSPDIIDINNYYSKHSECGTKPAILSITPPHANKYKPKSDLPVFPAPLTELYKQNTHNIIIFLF